MLPCAQPMDRLRRQAIGSDRCLRKPRRGRRRAQQSGDHHGKRYHDVRIGPQRHQLLARAAIASGARGQSENFQEHVAPALALLDRFDSVFDVLKPSSKEGSLSDEQIEALIADRARAKKSKDFAGADRIRQELLDQDVVLEDTKDGVRWKRK